VNDAPRPPEGDWLGTPFLRFEREGSLAVVTVDRPEKRNALTGSMYFGIRYAVDHVNATPELAGLLITGTGDVFIPGGDMSGEDEGGWPVPPSLGMDATPFDAIRRSAKPVVCAVNGIRQGGGMMIAMLADVSVASERATFRAPELLRGIADTNYGQILPRQIGPARARDMLLTGRKLTAAEALECGLIARVVPHDDVPLEARSALRMACHTAPGARATVKRTMDLFYGAYDRMGMEASLRMGEYEEGYRAFKERRPPAWIPDDLVEDDDRL
jgi:enoyl-CoA hydratase/carnithine racemase